MLDSHIDAWLDEDLALGDVTTDAIIPEEQRHCARMVAREAITVSGLRMAIKVFTRLDSTLRLTPAVEDGAQLAASGLLLTIEGKTRSILRGERLALNLVGRLSGIATRTRLFSSRIEGTGARVADTRKTTPGHRWLEKEAVRHGGGLNHRFSLGDGILIKDNHIAAAGGVRQAIRLARANARHHLLGMEVEVDTLQQLQEALEEGATRILLDNMKPEQLREAVALTDGRALLEASGGVSLETIRAIAETGVSLISVGGLVHGARWVDVGLDMEPLE